MSVAVYSRRLTLKGEIETDDVIVTMQRGGL
jgi:hypothetical protein